MLFDLRVRMDVPDNVDPNDVRNRVVTFVTSRGATVVASQVARVTHSYRVLTVNTATREVATKLIEATDPADAEAQVEAQSPDLVVAEVGS